MPEVLTPTCCGRCEIVVDANGDETCLGCDDETDHEDREQALIERAEREADDPGVRLYEDPDDES